MTTTTSPVTGGSLSTPPATGTTHRISDTDLAALRAMQTPVVSANDGACVCGAEDGLFANPDPSCGVAAHRHTARTVHQPEWDGHRCANCNTPLATAGPYCDITLDAKKASIR